MKSACWIGVAASLGLVVTIGAPRAAAQVAPAAGPKNLWSFLLPTAEQKAACKTSWCNSPLGKLVAAGAAPMAAMSGGLLENRCAANAIDEALKKDLEKNPEEGTAAAIKKSEAEAKARRAAVRYMGTVDCRYFKDVPGVLIKALREDPNECVRFEAALALTNGCCCNEAVVEALTNSVLGEDRKDKLPAERSERVRAAAAEALSRCALPKESEEPIPDPMKKKKKPDPEGKEQAFAPGTLHGVDPLASSRVYENARQALADYQANSVTIPGVQTAPALRPRVGSVSEILSGAIVSNRRPAAVIPDEPVAARMPTPIPVVESPEPKAVPAVLTSRPLSEDLPEVAPGTNKPAPNYVAPTAPAPVSRTVSAPAARSESAPAAGPTARRPFFDGLTRALKGKQTGKVTTITNIGTPVSSDLSPPASESAPVQPAVKIGVPATVETYPATPTTGATPTPRSFPFSASTSQNPAAPPALPGMTDPLPIPR